MFSLQDRAVVRLLSSSSGTKEALSFETSGKTSVPVQVWVWLANAHRIPQKPMNRLDRRDKVTGTAVFASECAP